MGGRERVGGEEREEGKGGRRERKEEGKIVQNGSGAVSQ